MGNRIEKNGAKPQISPDATRKRETYKHGSRKKEIKVNSGPVKHTGTRAQSVHERMQKRVENENRAVVLEARTQVVLELSTEVQPSAEVQVIDDGFAQSSLRSVTVFEAGSIAQPTVEAVLGLEPVIESEPNVESLEALDNSVRVVGGRDRTMSAFANYGSTARDLRS